MKDKNREYRKKIASDTLRILEEGYFLNSAGEQIDIANAQSFTEENTITYTPDMTDSLIVNRIPALLDEPANIEVNDLPTMDAVRKVIGEGHENVAYLNFASAKNPGGGFLRGSQAQEESIARVTGLYNSLMKAIEYYEVNRKTKSCFYTDYMIYSPNVPIIKDEEGNNMDTLLTASIITAPAVNIGVVKRRDPEKLNGVETVMKRRIEKVLAVALEHGHKVIVLGAWGCGVFSNDPNNMARYFNEVIEEKFRFEFKKIVFAVYSSSDRFIQPFYKEFY